MRYKKQVICINLEIMQQEEIEKSNGKNDYQYTLTNSDLLDKDTENLKEHSLKISNYYNFLTRINKPFIYDKIIVKNHSQKRKS